MVALLTFDPSERKSFDGLSIWKTDFEREDTAGNAVCILVGNKCDLQLNLMQVTEEEARQFAQENGMEYDQVSAFTGEGIFELMQAFVDIVRPRFPRMFAVG
jgi:Ras-related protein Rab-5C